MALKTEFRFLLFFFFSYSTVSLGIANVSDYNYLIMKSNKLDCILKEIILDGSVLWKTFFLLLFLHCLFTFQEEVVLKQQHEKKMVVYLFG
jgi:hypothetical protein